MVWVMVVSGRGSFEVLISILLVTALHPRRLDLDPLAGRGVSLGVVIFASGKAGRRETWPWCSGMGGVRPG